MLSLCSTSMNGDFDDADEFRYLIVMISKARSWKTKGKSSLSREENWRCPQRSGEWQEMKSSVCKKHA